MPSTETAIHWMELRRGTVGYSIASRNGNNTYDSSSAIYYALQAGELLPVDMNVGNTNTLFTDLPANSWSTTTSPMRGDVVLLGVEGSASGDAGVAAIFSSTTQVFHCSKRDGTVVQESYSALVSRLGTPPATIYHSSSNDSSSPTSLTNVGELEYLGIREGKIVAEGWHFSTGRQYEYIQFVNAVTNRVIETTRVTLTNRQDIADKYPNVSGVILSGFSASATVPNGTAVYIKGIRTNVLNQLVTGADVLTFSKIVVFEQATSVDEDDYPLYNNGMWYEIISGSAITHRDRLLLSGIKWSTSLMSVPSLTLSLPLKCGIYIEGGEEIKIYVNQKVFHGLVVGHEYRPEDSELRVSLRHIMGEWAFRQVSTNLAIKNQSISDIYSTLDFRYVGWNVEYMQDSATRLIDYVYSRQTKLNALTKTCEMTPDLYWRVSFAFGRRVEIGSFGERKPYVMSTRPSTASNIQILSGVTIEHDYDSVINIATVYGEKSDSGMSSISLRDVYNDPSAQDPNFPIVILRNDINNERNYDYIEFSALAPNTDLEYSVIDLESVAVENDIVKEGTFSYNDLSPFALDGEVVTDEDRAKTAMTLYQSAIKRLKQARRRTLITFATERLPQDLNVGDMVRFIYNWQSYELDACTNYECELIREDDWFYITSISYNIDLNGLETNTVTLEKFLHTDREGVIA